VGWADAQKLVEEMPIVCSDQRNIMGMERPQKITFAEMRSSCVRGLLIYCSDYKCSHYIAISGDNWSDDVRLSDIEPRFVCTACGKRGADLRPNFDWDRQGALMRGY
jgi:hypothetical protein